MKKQKGEFWKGRIAIFASILIIVLLLLGLLNETQYKTQYPTKDDLASRFERAYYGTFMEKLENEEKMENEEKAKMPLLKSGQGVAEVGDVQISPEILEIMIKYDTNPNDGVIDWTEYRVVVQENL